MLGRARPCAILRTLIAFVRAAIAHARDWVMRAVGAVAIRPIGAVRAVRFEWLEAVELPGILGPETARARIACYGKFRELYILLPRRCGGVGDWIVDYRLLGADK